MIPLTPGHSGRPVACAASNVHVFLPCQRKWRPWARIRLQMLYDLSGVGKCPAWRLRASEALTSVSPATAFAPRLRCRVVPCTMLHVSSRVSSVSVSIPFARRMTEGRVEIQATPYTAVGVYLAKASHPCVLESTFPWAYTGKAGLPQPGVLDGLKPLAAVDHWVYVFLFMYTNSSSR